MAAEAFHNFGGYAQLVGNKTDLINASLTTWANSGTGQSIPIVSTIAIGSLPILIGVLVYMRYQKVAPALISTLLVAMSVKAVETFYGLSLVSNYFMTTLTVLTAFALALAFFGAFRNKY